ncbi:ABC transporter permease subunit [Legionella longbeachae]|uniref:Putative spermidine/putrescine transport system permease protein potC n=1 Tax=Legionella longbeachae serogroup 1 (strain NSW150) TaxID=661367 RepID=D3HKP1_LEGLN|nr:ABC transporter permease subunit [Legionella longbeachae]VEE03523.1 spermidine/putrescine transport system permease potC [Legionella oakridgensis]HBD7397800.1 ABC transporter permease subunit [Legionella pneumophila]ARB93588.1 spermidine/putrescine ABC transporter permease PotC [Legionella longbeachae]ARM33274.1 ABC transporter permease subunit [Legionella longbeachae]EEZ93865.1 spermidine/putrescine ABC transporter permease protein PotC [Legionella longbeachae D-4968]
MKTFMQRLFLFFVYASLYVPIIILVLYSINDAKFSLQWHGFSLRWYYELFHDRDLWSAFLNSVILGLSSALIATTMGLLASIYLFLFRSKRRQIFYTLLLLLIIIPDLVLGVALLIFFNLTKVPIGFLSLLIAHITFSIPFVILTINARIHTLNPNIYFSALDLGASRYVALTRILLPLLWPAVLSVFLLSFTLSFDDVIISYFVAGPDFTILPLTIYSLVRTGVTPELNALCSIIFVLSMILVIISHRLSGKLV